MSSQTQVNLGFIGWLRWGWRQLTTMRVALWLLVLLGVAAIPGSIFPQRNTAPGQVAQYIKDNPELSTWVERFDGFDVYGSVWFSGIYLLLMVSLIGCIIPRIKVHVSNIRTPISAPPKDLSRADVQFELHSEKSLAELAVLLKKRRFRVRAFETEISAERGLLRETGNLAFHISILAILIAVALGNGFGYRGQIILREDAGFSNVLAQYDSFTPGGYFQTQWLRPFSVTLDDMQVDFQSAGPSAGAPADFRAYVTYQEDAQSPVQTKVVGVNNPLNIGNASMFLIGHGYAPHFKITDSAGNVVFNESVVFLPQDGNFTSTGVVKVPDLTPELGLDGIFAPTGVVEEMIGPHSIFPDLLDPKVYMSAWTGDLGLNDGIAQNVYLLDKTELQNIGIEELSVGETWDLPNGLGTVEFVGVSQYATFNIASDPGQNWALLAAILTILGVIAALYIQRGYIWIRRRSSFWEVGISGRDAEKYFEWFVADFADSPNALQNKQQYSATGERE